MRERRVGAAVRMQNAIIMVNTTTEITTAVLTIVAHINAENTVVTKFNTRSLMNFSAFDF